MNKKFSTLVAACLFVSGFANAETWDAPKGAEVATTVATGNYYHIGASDGTDYFFLTIKKNSDGAFQLITKKLETGALLAASTDSALWEPVAIKSQVPFPAAYTFKNKYTGKTLAVKYNTNDKENTANINAGKFDAVLVDPSTDGAVTEFTWGYSGSDSALVAYDAQNNPFVLEITGAEASVRFVKGTTGNMVDKGARPFNPAEIYMTADMLNEELNGSFKLNVSGTYTDKSEKPLIDEFVAFDCGSSPASNYPGVYMQAKGEKRNRTVKDADGNYLKNNNVFLAIDTVFAPGTANRDSINPKGLMFALDTISSDLVDIQATAWTVDSVAAGRMPANYRFFVYKNIGKVGSDSLIIKVDSLPTIGASGNSFSNPGTAAANAPKNAAYLANYSIGTGNTPLFTALDSAVIFEANKQNFQLPYIYLGAGIKANLAEGIYSIKDKGGRYYQAGLVYAKDGVYPNPDAKYDSLGTAACKDVPATQWRISGANGVYSMINRENGVRFKEYMGGIKTLYATDNENEYIYGDKTYVIAPIENVDEDDATLGYKYFTSTDLNNLAVRLRFTAFGGVENLYVVKGAAKDTLLHVNQIADVEDAVEFKLEAATDDVKYNASEGLSRQAYKLKVNDYKDDENTYLVYDEKNKAFALSTIEKRGDATANAADSIPVAVIFRQTCEGSYQILPVDTAMKVVGSQSLADGYKADSLWNKGTQLNVIGSNNLLVGSSVDDQPTGYFVLDIPEAPKYATVDMGHYRIQSVNNTSLAVTVNKSGDAVLRGAGESMLKSDPTFAAENFVLFVDSACTHNADEPMYYISTTQSTIGELTAEEKEEGVRYYMMNDLKDDGTMSEALVFAKAKQPFETADTLVVAPYAKEDTMVIANDDNRAAFAFQTTPTTGEYKIQNVATGKYVKQVNTVISLADGYANGNNFTLETQDTPTSNEDVAVSEVTVIATEGGVQIAGAAGKKVVISNILGQVVANTVLTSDNAVIAAPQGVVVVAVEGEEAVKAIVK